MAVGLRHYQRVSVMRFTDDGAYLISGGDDNLVVVWSMSRCVHKSVSLLHIIYYTCMHVHTLHPTHAHTTTIHLSLFTI